MEIIRSEKHKAFIRELPCAVGGKGCYGPIEAAHVRMGSDGGVGMKPSDCYIVPLCNKHHAAQHTTSEMNFWIRKCNRDPHDLAELLWVESGNTREAIKAVKRFAATGEVI